MSGAPFRDIVLGAKTRVGRHPASAIGRGRVQPEVVPPTESKRSQAQFPDDMRSTIAGLTSPRVEASDGIKIVRDARGRNTLRSDAPLHPGLHAEPVEVSSPSKWGKAAVRRRAQHEIGVQATQARDRVDEQGWVKPEVLEQPKPEGYVKPEVTVQGLIDRVDALVELAMSKPQYRDDAMAEVAEMAAQHPEVKAVVERWGEDE